jgi:hypothetical protein
LLEVKDADIVVGQYINNNGVVTASLPNMFFQRFIAVKANTAYTLSASEELNYANFMEYDSSGAFLKRTLFGSSTNHAGKTVTHTMGASTAFVIIGSNVNSEKYPSITKDNVKGIKWMFNEGSKALTYQAYKGEVVIDGTDTLTVNGEASNVSIQPLLGIGDYKDTQELISGAVNRKVGITVLDGTEDIGTSNSAYTIGISAKIRIKTTLLCTHFKYSTATSSALANNTIISFASQNVGFRNDACADVESFRQFLAREYAKGTPVTIVYPLANESHEQATAQTISNPKGTVTIVRDAEVSGLDIEATLKVEKAQGGFGAEFVFYAEGTGGWIPETYEFTAQEGMTWTDWLNSAYYIADDYFHIREEGDTLAAYWSSGGIGMQGYVTDEFGGYIKPSDVIINGYTYMFQ